ncbi:uncharacterized protein METZ01_LOCUS449284, partial [marine metagenome]
MALPFSGSDHPELTSYYLPFIESKLGAFTRTLLIGFDNRVFVLGHEYVPIGIFALIALSFPVMTFFIGRFFRPH